jgi:hypothetical protein
MKRFSIVRLGFFAIFMDSLLIGGALRTFYEYGSPTFWLGETILAMLILFTGLSILIAISVQPELLIELRARRKAQGKINRWERIFWYSISLTIIGIGALLSIGFLDRLLHECLSVVC